jgi:hypothetical protein
MKKLLTKDQNLIKEVEDVLIEKGVEFITYSPNKDGKIIAVLNRDGNALYEAVNKVANGKKYYLGVLRNHPECSAPKDLIDRLNSTKIF